MSKVSIIVPIYKVEEFLPKCLDSLIGQTFKDIEIWAISDGSPDKSLDIAKKYAKKDKRIKCVEKENGGWGSVIEYAINNIKTEYFMICDPDDWLREDAVEVLYNAATRNKVDFVRGNFYFVYSDDKKEEIGKGFSYPEIFTPESGKVYRKNVRDFWFLGPNPHAKLYKTELAKGIELPHHVSYDDAVLYKFYIAHCKSAMYIDEPLAYYLIDRDGNTMTDANPKIIDYHRVIFESTLKQYKEVKGDKEKLLYLMFLELMFLNSELCRIFGKKYNKYRYKLYLMLRELVNTRKSILPYVDKYNSGSRKISYHLLLNPVTYKLLFYYFSKVHINRYNR